MCAGEFNQLLFDNIEISYRIDARSAKLFSLKIMKKTKTPYYLHLITGEGFKMMTLAEAHQYSFQNNLEVWNVHESIDMEPDYFESPLPDEGS